MFEADFVVTRRDSDKSGPLPTSTQSWRWAGWKRQYWPAEVIRPRLKLYVYDLDVRKLIALMEITRGGTFLYHTKREFVAHVHKLTGWKPSSSDPYWRTIPEQHGEKSCTGIAFRWKPVKPVDIPIEVEPFPQIGWLSLINQQSKEASDLGSQYPSRTVVKATRIVRDTRLVLNLKGIHNHECQVCCNTLTLPDGTAYSEGHHLRPVGKPHNGPDTAGNILILCPNCHALCDLGGLELERHSIKEAIGHVITQEYLDYHNSLIVKAQSQQ